MPKMVLNAEELAWDEVKDDIKNANPDLAAILEQFNPKYNFVKARYLFGDKILHQGILHLPTKSGNTIPWDSSQIPETIRKKLQSNYIPISLILNKSVEIYFESDERVMPTKLHEHGSTFGLWEAFDPIPNEFLKKVWNICAGARTIFLLPKVSDNIAHARLKRLNNITAYPPKKILDQQNVFADLAHHAHQGETWYCDVLFFENKWLEAHEDNLSCIKLHKYWLYEAWRQSYNCRTQMSYDVAWEMFSKEVSRRNWKPKPYIINTIKHLMAIGEGIFPGFAPVGSNDNDSPVHLIQNAYIKDYQLKQAPIIMCPHHLTSSEKPVYYSLCLPTLLEYTPQQYNPRSIMSDMRELKMLMDLLLSTAKNHRVNYEFFHSDEDQHGEIKIAREMPEGDPNLLMYPKEFGNMKFPDNSPFFHGCVRISLK